MKGEGEAGKDKGEDNFRGEVGVPRFEGKDNLDSDDTKEFVFNSISSSS
jgi:hypothetical protein